MTTTDLLARVKDTRDQKGRLYDSELQTLLSHVVSHLETVRDIVAEHTARGAVTTAEAVERLEQYLSTGV